MNIITQYAATIRGATAKGNKGAIVLFDKAINKNDLVCDADISLETLANEIKSKDLIKSICIKELGTFYIGDSYDYANETLCMFNNTTAQFAYTSAKLTGRSAVMSNRVAIVTGGAQGFGEGIVRQLVEAEALVFIADMNIEGAKKLADELNLNAQKTVALPVAVNVTDEDSIIAMLDEVAINAGGVDLFVNNAGVLKAASVKEQTAQDLKFVTDVNYTGYFLCVKHVSKVMEIMNTYADDAYFTDIIQISSKSGLEGSNKNGSYAGSKFGGIGLTQSFALELVTDNTKVNSICPGNFFDGPLWSDPERGLFVQYLNTGKVPGAKTIEDVKAFYESKVPMNRGCDGKDVTKAILYAVEQEYETGQAIPVTGGQVMLN